MALTFRPFLAMAAAAALLAACAEPPPPRPLASLRPSASPLSNADDDIYRLATGDEIEITFARTPELSTRQIIRPDGGVSLVDAPVKEVRASELTVHQFRDELLRVYASELRDPDIAVVVRTFGSNVVYVTGEVGRPSAVPIAGPMTALQAILAADGLKPTSKPDQVLVIRRRPDGKASWRLVNLSKAFRRADLDDDVRLAPRDIVYVPRSHIGDIDAFVDLYIRQVLPIQPGIQIPFN